MDKMNEHRKKKHEEIEPKIERTGPPHHKIKEYQKNERKEEKTRKKIGNIKSKKAKIKLT